MTITARPDIVQQLLIDKPAFHLGGEARWDALPGALEEIRRSTSQNDTTIETGVGASTVVFAASGANHTAISPARAEHERVVAYCERIGVDASRIAFVEGLSDDVLPALLGRDRTLDFALIDGAHSFPFPEVDWYYITRALKVSGRLLVDDIPIPAVAPIFKHMMLEPNWRLDAIVDHRTALFTLLSLPEPELWSRQPFNRGYPDFSFVGWPKRFRLETEYRVAELRRAVGRSYPGLRRIRNRTN